MTWIRPINCVKSICEKALVKFNGTVKIVGEILSLFNHLSGMAMTISWITLAISISISISISIFLPCPVRGTVQLYKCE